MSSRDEQVRTAGGRPAALLAVRISPSDVGRRVTVRHRIDGSQLTDVVGVLRSWADGVLRVERRTGEVVAVAARDVVAAKVVTPELSATAMQRVAQAGWPPFETASLGEWELRASGGLTGRANSVRVVGDPGVPLEDALAHVSAWYAERSLPAILQLPEPSLWDDDLERLGWTPARRTTLRTVPTADLVAACGPVPDGVGAELSADPSPELLALVEPSLDPEGLARILAAPAERVFVALRGTDGGLLAAGRASTASSPAGRWAGVTSVAVAEHARRRGLGTAVMGELGRWAAAVGAPSTYLQVMAANEPAIALYARLGLVLHHTYVYRSPGPISSR
ncbi:GNAT family N-acetyltransferase [Longivirga aurantiaca]|uniref:GNAT family N-acetyltransferase n=1 Tax=Longivirga aurantiaca TaxID=1837743 RepID=A0ABW1T0R8_9ACTN